MSTVWDVVILDPYPTSMLGIQLILDEQCDLEVKATASKVTEGLKLIVAHQPHLILVSYRFPEGTARAWMPQIKRVAGHHHVVILTDQLDMPLFFDMMNLGASGLFCIKYSSNHLLHLISGLRKECVSFPLELFNHKEVDIHKKLTFKTKNIELTDIETFIMKKITQGVPYHKIAEEMMISRRSIDNYLQKIYFKMGVTGRSQAIERFALL